MSETVSKVVERPAETRQLEDAFARYQGELLGTLYYLVGNSEDARDALQETFVKCWKHRDEVAAVENLKAWIFRIAMNTGRDMRQTAWQRKKRPLPEDHMLDGQALDARDDSPAEQLERSEQNDLLRSAILQLRPEEQEVFLLRQNGELTYEDIANSLGIPTGTVKTRMRLAITRLRELLSDW